MTTRPTDEEIRSMLHPLRSQACFIGGMANDVADWLEVWLAERQAARDGVTDLVKGMSVSVDVSTNDADAGNRYFGTIEDVMDYPDSKLGLMLLVTDAKPNFSTTNLFVSDEIISAMSRTFCELSCQFGWDENNLNLYQRETLFRAALQSISKPITSVSDALNFLEKWALGGGKLSGDDVQRFHAAVERIGPIEQTVKVTDEMARKIAQTFLDAYWHDEKAVVLSEDVENMRQALQSIAPPIISVSDALNFLEEWAISGNTLHGDDIQRFRATVERIAPVAKTVSVPEEKEDLDPVKLHRQGRFATEFERGFNEGWNDCREAMLSAAPAYNGKKEG